MAILHRFYCSLVSYIENKIGFRPRSGAQWLSGRVLDSRLKGRVFEPHRRLCVVSLSKNINPSLVLVLPRKTRPFITERLLMGPKKSNQTNQFRPRSDCFLGIHIVCSHENKSVVIIQMWYKVH